MNFAYDSGDKVPVFGIYFLTNKSTDFKKNIMNYIKKKEKKEEIA